MDHFDFRLYRDSDVHAVVQMWKESRDGWPPGFFGASDISASSVEQEEKGSGKLFTVLALDGDRVVGYCRTSPYPGEQGASYVDLLNAVPDKHGSGIGKALLLDAISRSVQFRMNRIDLHTWPANMKAVPLYKKTGFFWVPDSMVYMQNYMPFLLGRAEFNEFLGDSDWYQVFHRALEVKPDQEKTSSGREIFRYEFKKEEEVFAAEFDRQGRCLSKMEYPGFTAGLSVDIGGEYFAGRPVTVTLTGSGFSPDSVSVSSADSLPFDMISESSMKVKPLPVRIPSTIHDPADRVLVKVGTGDLPLGIGMLTCEEVALYGEGFKFLPAGADSVSLGVKSLGNVTSAAVSYSVDGGETLLKVLPITDSRYQSISLDLPELATGVHTMSVQIGRTGYTETVVLVTGIPADSPQGIETRKCSVTVSGGNVMTVMKKSGRTRLYLRDDRGQAVEVSNLVMYAGPPSWSSELTKQKYHLQVSGDTVTGKTPWPSRPGLEFSFELKLNPAGYASGRGFLFNGSDKEQKINFRVDSNFSNVLGPKTDLFPVPDGLLAVKRVYNQVPDWDEDLSAKVSGLAAPWNGVEGPEHSAMRYFSNWTEFEYDIPGTADIAVPPGGKAESPLYRLLCTPGNTETLLQKADALGWDVGNWRKRVQFEQNNLQPVMETGTEVFLTHPLHGKRKAALKCDGVEIAEGIICRGKRISGKLSGEGYAEVALEVAGRPVVKPVFLLSGSEEVEALEKSERLLTLSNSRISASLDPMAFGQVYSLLSAGREFMHSSHPEPSEFAWEKPWYGGIHPRYSVRRPFELDKVRPVIQRFTETTSGAPVTGWKMSWTIDHKDFGSVLLEWKTGLMPEVPVLTTELFCTAVDGEYKAGELDIRGFLQPGGSVENTVLTCENFPSLRQGRNHAGAWAHLGAWGRVQGGSFFTEAYQKGHGGLHCEDYAAKGCHMEVAASHHRERKLSVLWLFGSTEDDGELARVLREHR